MLAAKKQSATGKKAELVARVALVYSEEELLDAGIQAKYVLTEIGQQEVNENAYVPYMHSIPSKTTEDDRLGMTFNVWSINKLLGTGDKSLADHESIEVYSLSDGTTALLRYRDDTLMDAYLRDKDNIETSIFGQNASNMSGVNGVNDTNNSYTETNMGYEESGESRERR